MNCDECKDQVFELIEREAVDPAGVRAILDRCPECRGEFQRLKAALVLAEGLPLEEPPAEVDAGIIEAAGRGRTVSTASQRRFQPIPWAIAAVALLGIGLGYVQSESWLSSRDGYQAADAEVEASPRSPPPPADRVIEQAVSLDEDRTVRALGSSVESSQHAANEAHERPRAETPARTAAAKPKRMGGETPRSGETQRQKRAVLPNREQAASGEQAPTGMQVAESAQAASVALAAEADAAGTFADEAPEEESAIDGKPDLEACKKRTEAARRRKSSDDDDAFDAEDELELGRCYLALGKPKAARTWLERAAAHPETAVRAKAALRELE